MTKYIELHGIYGRGELACVDDEDYGRVNKYLCYSDVRGYVYIVVGGSKHLLHRYILGVQGQRFPMIDHKDHNRKNNQKTNLRKCTNSQNQANTKSWGGRKTKGVYLLRNKWVARIMVNGNRFFLGGFSNKDSAIQAYKDASLKYFGEFAYQEQNG